MHLLVTKVEPVIAEMFKVAITRRSMAKLVLQMKIIRSYDKHQSPSLRIQAGIQIDTTLLAYLVCRLCGHTCHLYQQEPTDLSF